jgi:hypothetical protein
MNIGHHLDQERRGKIIRHRQLLNSRRLEYLVTITMGV